MLLSSNINQILRYFYTIYIVSQLVNMYFPKPQDISIFYLLPTKQAMGKGEGGGGVGG